MNQVFPSIVVQLPKELYDKKVIFHAIYVLLEEEYFTVDCNETHYIVEIFVKEPCSEKDLEEKKLEFHKELIEAVAYFNQLEKTSKIRESILQKALFSQKALEDLQKLEK
jgi:His-Xaa-Ser system protein HxsD